MRKLIITVTLIFVAAIISIELYAQHFFYINQNDLSHENRTFLQSQVAHSDIYPLPLARNNENKEVYPVAISSAQNTRIVILNEQNGNNAVITPVEESLAQFQLAPFFIEELRQGVLGGRNPLFSFRNRRQLFGQKRNIGSCFERRCFYSTLFLRQQRKRKRSVATRPSNSSYL